MKSVLKHRTIHTWLLPLLCACGLGMGQEPARDAKADQIADEVMEAMGGAEAYDKTHFITWRFFGRRLHVWDKYTGDIRAEDGKGLVVIMNLNTKQGKAWQEGTQITDETELQDKLKWGYEVWINDSYWLVMPYKLKDPGVHLTFTREDQTEDGRSADVLTLTFDNVGVTPENKYEVFVDKESRLVTQWRFYTKAEDEEPRFTTPWANWQQYGNILLSDDRGRSKHSDIAVFDKLPVPAFDGPDPVVFPSE